MKVPSCALVICYVAAAVVANLAVWKYGQAALLVTAVVLIPFDFLCRDVLHSRWENENDVLYKMAALIVCGSLVTLVCNPAARWVAVARATAFLVSATVDALVFDQLGAGLFGRMMVSNIVGAVFDSVVFPMVAFGVIDWRLSVGQAVLKISGGLVVSVLYLMWCDSDNSDA